MHPADIRAAITKAGTTQAAIAQQLHVSAGAVWNVVNGKGRSDSIAQHIADLVQIPTAALWPSVYTSGEQLGLWSTGKPHLRLSTNGDIVQVSMRRASAQPRA